MTLRRTLILFLMAPSLLLHRILITYTIILGVEFQHMNLVSLLNHFSPIKLGKIGNFDNTKYLQGELLSDE